MPVPKDFAAPARMSAKERAYTQLQKWIIDGTLAPGEKLLDAELAQTFGVSRTPVREAFQLLEMQGLVVTSAGKDTKVSAIGKEDIHHLLPVTAALHAAAAEQAAAAVTEERLGKLRDLNARYTQAIERGQPARAQELDGQFHQMIADLSGNPYLRSYLASLQLHMERYRNVFQVPMERPTFASVQEHASMIDLLARADGAAIPGLVRKHFDKLPEV